MKESIVKNKSYQFALQIIKVCRELKNQKEFEMANQLFRSGTSIGANIEEALAGISDRDFTAKMSISSKEARETNYWLRLIKDSEIQVTNIDILLYSSTELIKMLTSIVKTSQAKLEQTKNPK
jgi:four helix bundle protein